MAELHPQPEDETVFYTYWILLVFILNAIFPFQKKKNTEQLAFPTLCLTNILRTEIPNAVKLFYGTTGKSIFQRHCDIVHNF